MTTINYSHTRVTHYRVFLLLYSNSGTKVKVKVIRSPLSVRPHCKIFLMAWPFLASPVTGCLVFSFNRAMHTAKNSILQC